MERIDEFISVVRSGNDAVVRADQGIEALDFSPLGLKIDARYVPNLIPVTFNVPAGAAAADYDGVPFIADKAYEVVAVRERHGTAGSAGGAVTLMVKKVPSGTALGSGTDVLSAGINLKATADTVQSGSLHATQANRQLVAGDGLGLVPSGTLTAVDAVSVTVYLQQLVRA